MPLAGKLTPLFENVRRHLLMFNVEGDHDPRLNVPGRPMLDPIMGSLLVLAFVRALMSPPDHRLVLLLTWMLAALLGGILSNLSESPQAYRTFDLVPALCLLIGELVASLRTKLAQLLRGVASPRSLARAVSHAAVAVALGASTVLNLQSYFEVFASDPQVYIGFTPLRDGCRSGADPGSRPDELLPVLQALLFLSSALLHG